MATPAVCIRPNMGNIIMLNIHNALDLRSLRDEDLLLLFRLCRVFRDELLDVRLVATDKMWALVRR